MGVTVGANGLSIVHKGSGGEANATLPDVCLTKVGKPIVPIPYGNNAKSADLAGGTTTISMDGGNSVAIKGSTFSKSTGDAGGDKKGVASGTIEAEAKFISASPTVKFEGKGVCRLSDQMTMNKANTMCLGGAQNPSVSVTEADDGTFTIDIDYRYPDGDPVYKADFKIIDSNGSEHVGTLSDKGKGTITGLPAGSISLFLGEDKRDIEPIQKPQPNKDYLDLPSPMDLVEFAGRGLVEYWDAVEMPSDYGQWAWGAIMGDFNQDRSAGQIAFDSAVTAIPFIDQIGDGRDISANLYAFYNADDIREDKEKYTDLVITLVGFIPTAGSLIKGLFKELKILGKAADLEMIAAFLRAGAKGDVVKWMQSLDMSVIKNDIYGQLDDITKQVKTLMDTLEQESRKRGYTVVADAYKRCVEQLDDFFKKADGPISKVLSDFDDRLKMILPEAPLVTSGTSFSISAGTAQGGSKAEVIKTRNKTKKKTDTCPLCNKKIGKGKKECEGAKVGSISKAVMDDGSSQKLWKEFEIRNGWRDKTEHPWWHGAGAVQAHHLIPKNAFKLKNAKSKQTKEKMMFLRRIAQMCAYNIDFWKNGVGLPNKKETACFLRKPRHAGGHDRNEFNYTNECVKLVHHKLSSDINKRTKEGSCSKTTNSSLIMKFNESSKNIFDNIADFIWFITRDGKNYDPKVEPYVGCSSNCKKIHPIININTKRQIENYDLEIGK
ncbi:PAAR-like domain-containing protein [Vibrio owensii]